MTSSWCITWIFIIARAMIYGTKHCLPGERRNFHFVLFRNIWKRLFCINPFLTTPLFLYSPEHIRKPLVFWYFQGVWEETMHEMSCFLANHRLMQNIFSVLRFVDLASKVLKNLEIYCIVIKMPSSFSLVPCSYKNLFFNRLIEAATS